ncbi:MAG: hypothetical protein ACK6BG_08620 [Cyanobacteriota bacterium]
MARINPLGQRLASTTCYQDLSTVKANQQIRFRQVSCPFEGKRQIPLSASVQETKQSATRHQHPHHL